MHRLNPSTLLGLCLDLVATREIEQDRCAVAQQRDKALTDGPMTFDDIVGVWSRQCRDHLTVVTPRCAPARLHRFDHNDISAGLAQMQRCREARKTRADHDDIGLLCADQFG